MENHIAVTFDAISANEALARMVVSAFVVGANPTVDEMTDIKTAVSEAVTNAVIHGYQGKEGDVLLKGSLSDRDLTIQVQDFGVGIEDIHRAREPFFTTKPELERSGLGFAFMETFMDEVQVQSKLGEGTTVVMKKSLKEGT